VGEDKITRDVAKRESYGKGTENGMEKVNNRYYWKNVK